VAVPTEDPVQSARLVGETVRVEVDADLAVEVAVQETGVEVTLEGTREALRPLREGEGELKAALSDSGSDLLSYEQRERQHARKSAQDLRNEAELKGRRGDRGSRDEPASPRRPVGQGSLINVVA
jgi:hypothetical protein